MTMTDALFSAANDNNPGYYVYLWRKPCGEPFYIGKGRGKRAWDTYDRSTEFRDIHGAGGCMVEIVDWFIHESQALAFEVELIARYGRSDMGGTLVNKTDGGDGCVGHTKSADTIAKWREKNVGRKRSPEIRAKISAGKKGHHVDAATRAKISAAQKKRFEDPIERAKASELRSNPSDETRKRMSSAQSRRLANDPSEVARLRDRLMSSPMTDERKAKISASTIGVPKAPSAIENMRVAQRMKPPRGQYKGVSADGKRWRASIFLDGKNSSLGTYANPEDAGMAYDRAAIAHHGAGNCYLNFPDRAFDSEGMRHAA